MELLSDLASDLESDLILIERAQLMSKQAIKSSEIVANSLTEKIPFSDSLANHFGSITIPFVWFTPNQSTYETLKGIGFSTIKNKTVRARIQTLYSVRYKSFEKNQDHFNTEFTLNIDALQPKYLYVNRGNFPIDYQSLQDNIEFINNLYDMVNLHTITLDQLIEYETLIHELISDIQIEIQNRI